MNYYNEFDPHAAAWLRELIARKLIPDGIVDERSITEIHAPDLQDFTQCHFFAGIGGWSLALQLAGVSPDTRLWTGSCPCQPFSSAGKGEGKDDERHLWPVFFDLIKACRPPVVFGEQVASALVVGKAGGGHREEDGPVWLDGVFADLESAGYATGATVLGAHSVGAPHIRQRLYWVAHTELARRPEARLRPEIDAGWEPEPGRASCRLAYGISEGLEGHRRNERDGGEPGRLDADATGSVGGMGNPIDTAHERDARGLSSPEEGEHGARVAINGGLSVGSEHAGSSMDACGMGDARRECDERRGGVGDVGHPAGEEQGQARQRERRGNAAGDPVSNDHWRDSVWLPCRDGKHRRVPAQSVLQPVADGLPDLVGSGWGDLLEATPRLAEAAKGFPLASSDPFKLATRGTVRPALLKGAGNAIVPEVAATFISAFYEVTQ